MCLHLQPQPIEITTTRRRIINLRRVTLHAHLLAERLSVGSAISIADQNVLGVLELRHKLVPCWLHGFAVTSPGMHKTLVSASNNEALQNLQVNSTFISQSCTDIHERGSQSRKEPRAQATPKTSDSQRVAAPRRLKLDEDGLAGRELVEVRLRERVTGDRGQGHGTQKHRAHHHARHPLTRVQGSFLQLSKTGWYCFSHDSTKRHMLFVRVTARMGRIPSPFELCYPGPQETEIPARTHHTHKLWSIQQKCTKF